MKPNWVVRAVLLGIFLAVTLSGCSLFESKPSASPVNVPSVASPVGIVEQGNPSRELGSLWSETSKWNEFYSAPSGRNMGDLVVLKPSETFKSALNTSAGKGAQLDAAITENARIVGTIKEVLPRQVYRFEARQPLRVGKLEYFVTYRGKIRDQDIAADDTGTTDAVFDGQLQVENKTIEAGTPVATNQTPAAHQGNDKSKDDDKDKEEEKKP